MGPLSSSRARARDRAGEQYAVLLSSGGRPVGIVEIAWAEHYCSTWLLDEELRRDFQVEGRLLAEGRFFIQRMRSWTYANTEQPELDGSAARRTWVVHLDGRMWQQEEPGGDHGGRRDTGSKTVPEDCWVDVPEFGDWSCFAALLTDRDWKLAEKPVLRDVSPVEGDGLPAEERPWRPPRPLAPRNLDRALVHGSRFRLDSGDEVTVEVRRAGTLRMPSGRVAGADPGRLEGGAEPFTTAIPPGEYDLMLSWVRLDAEPDHRRMAAARLAVRDVPVTSWELALLDGQGPRARGEEEFFGFGVDSGLGCFVDAAAVEALASIADKALEEKFGSDEDDETPEFTDPATGANLIVFPAGWGDGSYPTWIGRGPDGEVAALVADMLIVNRAEPLDPQEQGEDGDRYSLAEPR
ncbi:DUF4241 domain-containing protein [Actinomadura sp. LOL_016]|uniref:DUF4241 domain-containing protein n=1 Tax=unclassified Actinomadura TaxID=2626254 RepID=UPI003A81222C